MRFLSLLAGGIAALAGIAYAATAYTPFSIPSPTPTEATPAAEEETAIGVVTIHFTEANSQKTTTSPVHRTHNSVRLACSNGKNNFTDLGNTSEELKIHRGGYDSQAIWQISVEADDYYVSGYRFDFRCAADGNSATITIGDQTYTNSSTEETTHVEVTGIAQSANPASFVLVENNSGIIVSEFYVELTPIALEQTISLPRNATEITYNFEDKTAYTSQQFAATKDGVALTIVPDYEEASAPGNFLTSVSTFPNSIVLAGGQRHIPDYPNGTCRYVLTENVDDRYIGAFAFDMERVSENGVRPSVLVGDEEIWAPLTLGEKRRVYVCGLTPSSIASFILKDPSNSTTGIKISDITLYLCEPSYFDDAIVVSSASNVGASLISQTATPSNVEVRIRFSDSDAPNNASKVGDFIKIATGSNADGHSGRSQHGPGSCLIEIKPTNENYYVTDYCVDFHKANADSNTLTLYAGDNAAECTSTTDDSHFEVRDLTPNQAAIFALKETPNDNKGILIPEIRVKIAEIPEKVAECVEVLPMYGMYTSISNANQWIRTWNSHSRWPITLTTSGQNLRFRSLEGFDHDRAFRIRENGTLAIGLNDGHYNIGVVSFTATNRSATADATITFAGTTTTIAPGAYENFTLDILNNFGQTIAYACADGDDNPLDITNLTVTTTTETPQVEQSGTEIALNPAEGEYHSIGTSDYAASWKSNPTADGLIIKLINGEHENDMDKAAPTGQFKLHGGSNGTSYALFAGTDYYVTGYEFEFSRVNANNPATISTATYSLTDAAQGEFVKFAANHLTEQDYVASFSLSDNNTGVAIRNMKVWVAPRTTSLNIPFLNDATEGHDKSYRIPAIATIGAGAHAGRLVAVSDLRNLNSADLGANQIDVVMSTSDNNGATWTPVSHLLGANGQSVSTGTGNNTGNNNSAEPIDHSYGDPAIVADRESEKVLVLSVGGAYNFWNSRRTFREDGTMQGTQAFSWTSDDAGDTWTPAKCITEQIYGLFDGTLTDTEHIDGIFFGSGRIHQSRYVKTGDYYRLYVVISGQKGGVHASTRNWVLFSDDFGQTWAVLGDVNAPAVASSADEPKAEELPDGSVLLTARAQNGNRNLNIFRYTDFATGEGAWDTVTNSNLGVTPSITQCNGEMLILPVAGTTDPDTKAYIAIQSIPLADSRVNVGVTWKILEGPDDILTPAALGANWDGRYQVSSTSSGYSVMSVTADNHIAFLYEETVIPGCIYSHTFRNLSIEEITDGAWSYTPDSDNEIANTIGRATFVARVSAITGNDAGKAILSEIAPSYSATAADLYNRAFNFFSTEYGEVSTRHDYVSDPIEGTVDVSALVDAFKTNPSAETLDAVIEASTPETITLLSGAKYRLVNKTGRGALTITDAGALAITDEAEGTPFVITLNDEGKATLSDGTLYIVDNGTAFTTTTDPSQASAFAMTLGVVGGSDATNCTNAFSFSTDGSKGIHCQGGGAIIRHNITDGTNTGSFWYVEPANTVTVALPDNATTLTLGDAPVAITLTTDAPASVVPSFTIAPEDAPVEVDEDGCLALKDDAVAGATATLTPSITVGGKTITGEALTLTIVDREAPAVTDLGVEEGSEIRTDYDPATADPDAEEPETYLTTIDSELHLIIRHNTTIDLRLAAQLTAQVVGHYEVRSSDPDIADGTLTPDGKITITHGRRIGHAILSIVFVRPRQPEMLRSVAEEDAETTVLSNIHVEVRLNPDEAMSLEKTSNRSAFSISIKRTLDLSASIAYTAPEGVENAVVWSSSNPDIATVDPSTGLVTAVGEGSAVITAAVEGHPEMAVTFTVTVTIPSGPIGSGIEAINADAAVGTAIIYDLSGRRLERIAAPGIYIVNGHKIVIR